MKITRRHILATITATTVLAASGMVQAADTVRIGLPTKTYWPTTIAACSASTLRDFSVLRRIDSLR